MDQKSLIASLSIPCPECGYLLHTEDAVRKHIQSELEKSSKDLQVKMQTQEKLFKEKQAELDKQKADIDSLVEKQLKAKLQLVQQTASKEAKEKISLELEDLKNQINEKQEALQKAQASELELRKAAREVQEKEKNLELEVQRRVQDQVDSEKQAMHESMGQEFQLKLLEKEKQIRDMQVKLEEAKRASLQGSQQNQGEAVEDDIESQLKARYPTDTFDPVPKGAEGADLVHSVRNSSGQVVGTTVIELKNTRTFPGDCIQKLARDQRVLGADAAILITKTLPKDAPPISIIDGVFVVSLSLAVPFISIIRKSIEELSYARATTQGQDEKMKLIYSYLTGPAFKQKITSIVNAFETLMEQHEGEKKYFKKMWASREKMLEQVIDSATGMYGDIEGIAGRILPEVKALALPEVKEVETVLIDGRGDQ
ncbi:hypothetical protein AZI87_17075 [Bdellovibrio bacteriovorus]|uniref:DUF2130 domain-containing protein n=1 Tax=Bdellovibrio bacteriovorus TaxID=959 RepID=A0A162G0Q4_BDEBC|nr:DUF2130 domain-containing protein [Bdellovibrio bacteriovorus]KYG62973.1 hypothetical protein AZI87_17075 [Bdellovibrio bacteriovorus]